MKNRNAIKALGLGILVLMLLSLVFACSAASNKLIEQYKAISQQMLDAAKSGNQDQVATLSSQMQTIGEQLGKLKLSKAQQKDLEDFTNKIMQDLMSSMGQ